MKKRTSFPLRPPLFSTLALFFAASTACVTSAAYAVEGYNINEGQDVSSPGAATRPTLRRFTDFNTPVSQPVGGAPIASTTFNTGTSTPEPIVLTPPPSMRASTASTAPEVNLAETSTDKPYVAPVSEVIMPSKPLYPARSGGGTSDMPTFQALTSKPVLAKAPSVPPVPVPATETKTTSIPPAPEEIKKVVVEVPDAPKVASAPLEIKPVNDVPPAPSIALLPPPPPLLSQQGKAGDEARKIIADASEQTQPKAVKVSAPPVVAQAPEALGSNIAAVQNPALDTSPPLSNESKRIIGNIRTPVAVSGVEKAKRVDMKRINPEVADIVKKAEEVYESAGVSIRVSASAMDPTTELGAAYDALMGGDTEVAIRIYQEILSRNPAQEDALFGLAATYHRTGQVDNARPLYGRLLAQNPNNREALNNFLMLVSNESPRDALQELAQLERRNPDYSPIPAQMGIILDRIGDADAAQSKMMRAIELSPENWVYKYNLAIMLDRRGAYADAASIYGELIQASLQGATLPVDMDALQARLNYIAQRTGTS